MVSSIGPSSAPLAFAWIRSITRRSSRHDRPQYSSAGDPTVETYRASWPLNLVGRDWRIPYQGGRQGLPGPSRLCPVAPLSFSGTLNAHDAARLSFVNRINADYSTISDGVSVWAKATSRSLGR